jgi:hypothetical protein
MNCYRYVKKREMAHCNPFINICIRIHVVRPKLILQKDYSFAEYLPRLTEMCFWPGPAFGNLLFHLPVLTCLWWVNLLSNHLWSDVAIPRPIDRDQASAPHVSGLNSEFENTHFKTLFILLCYAKIIMWKLFKSFVQCHISSPSLTWNFPSQKY